MNEIIIERDYGVIIFHDKSHRMITEDQFNKLVINYSNPNVTKIQLGDSLFSKNSISKILTVDEFNKEYPQEVSDRKYEDGFKKYEGITQRSIGPNGLASMIRGLEKFIQGYRLKYDQNPTKAIFERDRLIKKYEKQYAKT